MKRAYVFNSEFRREHKSARAFLAPQRDRPAPVKGFKPAEFPKRKPRAYRGSDNPKARKPISTTAGGHLTLTERAEPMMPSAKSRRYRRHIWVSA